jgi:hypothetical protein
MPGLPTICMKPLSCLLLLFCGCLYGCNHNNAARSSSPGNRLIPYAQRYVGSEKKDTLFPGNIYLKYRVRRDTADGNLYICYGGPGFDSVYTQHDGAPFNCSSWEYAYHTPGAIGLMYECPGERQLLVLPLRAGDSVRVYTPLFVGVEDSLVLVEDAHAAAGGLPALIAADLDFKQQKPFQLPFRIPCADMLACFDTIYFNKKLVMEYETGAAEDEPVKRVQAETLSWKK